MRNVLYLFLLAVSSSLFPIVGCDYLGVGYSPGVFCFDIFLFSILFFCERTFWVQVFFSMVPIGMIWMSSTSFFSVYSLIVFALAWISYFLVRKRFVYVMFALLWALLVFVANWSLFFEYAYKMSLGELWGVAKFFWWGILLFFLVPTIQLAIFLLFGKALVKQKVCLFSPLVVMALLLSVMGTHFALAELQSRQPFLDFPVYNFLKQQMSDSRITQSSVLQEDIKEKYNILTDQDVLLDSLRPTVVVLVESWGVRKNFRVNDDEFKVFDSNDVIKKGLWNRRASFTQAAEWEDLGLNDYKRQNYSVVDNYAKNGFETWYVHGFDGSFYDREKQYKNFGFQHLKFKEDLLKESLNLCHNGNVGFEGVCDSSVAVFIDALLADSVPKFLYWTTLDSHPPYDTQKVPESEICLGMDDVECVHAVRVRNSLKAISVLAQKHPEYRFVIRGDHRPGLLGISVAKSFVTSFYYCWVPIIILN